MPEIPLVDASGGPLQLAEIQAWQLQRILRAVCEIIPPALLRWGDAYAAHCLRRGENPYLHEIESVARLLGRPGAHALNFSFELGCTTACQAEADSGAMRLYRTLDWPFRLGRDVVAARHASPVGAYLNVTWPGFVGVLTGMAPGRFAAAINQAPMSYSFARASLGLPIDWMVNRWRVRRAAALPPAHLLRHVFEHCATYAEAKAMLTTTAVCIPAIYTLTGTTPGEGCIIERRERDSVVHPGPACVTNHWLNDVFTGRPRARNSGRRLAAMRETLPSLGKEPFDWLAPPVLNRLTRMAAELDASTGALEVQGWHGDRPQTKVRKLNGA